MYMPCYAIYTLHFLWEQENWVFGTETHPPVCVNYPWSTAHQCTHMPGEIRTRITHIPVSASSCTFFFFFSHPRCENPLWALKTKLTWEHTGSLQTNAAHRGTERHSLVDLWPYMWRGSDEWRNGMLRDRQLHRLLCARHCERMGSFDLLSALTKLDCYPVILHYESLD